MSNVAMVWKKPTISPNAVAIPDTLIAWLSQQADLNRVKAINRVFDRLVVSSFRYSAYRMLISDENLLSRTQLPQYNAPLNMIRRSLSANLIVAVCALHDKSSGAFSIERFIDRMIKDKFHLRAIDHHAAVDKTYDASMDVNGIVAKREAFNLPRWKEDFKILQTLRHEHFVHFSMNVTDLSFNRMDEVLENTYNHSLDAMFTIRRLFVGNYRDLDLEELFGERAQWQARNLASMLHPSQK